MHITDRITGLLAAWNEGDKTALDKLMPLVEQELRRIAARRMRRENRGHTLQTTALINETYLKLIDQRAAGFKDRAHFFALAAQIMRRVLLDHARRQNRLKRGGGAIQINLAEAGLITPVALSEDIIALDEALTRLAEFDRLKSQIVEMRHFGGLSVEEIGECLNVSPVTVRRHWSLAKAWLRSELRKGSPEAAASE